MGEAKLRDFRSGDAHAVDALAERVILDLRSRLGLSPAMASDIERMSDLARAGRIIVADDGDAVVGAVAYIPQTAPRPSHFDRDAALIRMLVIDPERPDASLASDLAARCIALARAESARRIVFHSWPVMSTYTADLLKLGFKLPGQEPEIHGILDALYVMELT
jgi:predicted N-acetyltransferase YhbS